MKLFFGGACGGYIAAETLSVSEECKVVAIGLSKRGSCGGSASGMNYARHFMRLPSEGVRYWTPSQIRVQTKVGRFSRVLAVEAEVVLSA